MKFCIRSYWKPTPKKLRQLGDSLLAAVLIGMPYLQDNKLFMTIFVCIAVIGKFLTNFFTEDSNDGQQTN